MPILEELKVEDGHYSMQATQPETQPGTQPQLDTDENEPAIVMGLEVIKVCLRTVPAERALALIAPLLPQKPRVKVAMTDFSMQTEEHKLDHNNHNPEENENSSSFSNPLPSSASSEERSRI